MQSFMDWMKQSDIQASFITSKENVFYLSGFRSEPHERLLGILAFQDEEPILVCPAMEKEDARNAGWEYEIIGHSDTDRPWDMIEKSVNARIRKVHKWAIEKEHLNVERYEELKERYTGAAFVSAEEKLRVLRMIKDEKELEILRKAAEFADFAIQTGVEEIKEGKSELEIIAKVEYELKKKGISEMSFSTMVLTGANGASPHGNPGSTKIKKGDLVLFDLGVVYQGYCSDITRTVAYDHYNDKQEEIYQTVLKAQLAAVEAVKPGVKASQLDKTARKMIADAGYGDYFPHRLGHGLGVSVHEYPALTETNDLTMEEGMVFTIEPGIYVPNVAGVRIEDDLLITADGVESFTKFPKDLQIIK
ncbi:aminopeptidase P family protein [Falsibacillus albus]|uniref:Aminopeptidase P family protein n=2 Tax=Falsibacillus albus TaxID=2478915 RepID=A0A3L7K8A9_9BACI|nr:Xaa-Pro peptidase family protein [Falsibacillus albus]RLQ98311.1 aminopeptidase P family protein [Falsibacillus albus]